MKGFVIALAIVTLLVTAAIAVQANGSNCVTTSASYHKTLDRTPIATVTGLPTVNQVLWANVGPTPRLAKVAASGSSIPLGTGPSNADFYWNF